MGQCCCDFQEEEQQQEQYFFIYELQSIDNQLDYLERKLYLDILLTQEERNRLQLKINELYNKRKSLIRQNK